MIPLLIGCSEPLDDPIEHRVEATPCDPVRPTWEPSSALDPDRGCTRHEDCTDGLNGRCRESDVASDEGRCDYDECLSDADCDGVCECRTPLSLYGDRGSRCVPSDCAIDADCSTEFCSPSIGPCGRPEGYYCVTSRDQCRNHDDCECSSGSDNDTCFESLCEFAVEAGRWSCTAHSSDACYD